MKDLISLQDMEYDKIKSLIKAYSKFKKGDSFIIDNLIEDCNLTKEEAEDYLELYNEGEL